MDWKLSRGKWRARLQSFVAALSDDEVQAASQKAFAALPDLKGAIGALSVLKGAGPATASAVLTAHALMWPFSGQMRYGRPETWRGADFLFTNLSFCELAMWPPSPFPPILWRR